jgi:molybdenum cofactor cytidylyltransferase
MNAVELPVVIVLACGVGRRFRASLHEAGVLEGEDNGWGHKLHARLGDHQVLDWTVAAARASGLPVYVHEGLRFEGMGGSIAAAVRETSAANGWLILPGDLPLVAPHTIGQVAQALQVHKVVVPRWQGQRAHPVGFQAVCREALSALDAEVGAAPVVKAMGAIHVEVDDPGVVQDVDTWADLQRLRGLLSGRGPVHP